MTQVEGTRALLGEPSTESPDTKRTKALTLLVLCFALFMVMLDNSIVNLALPKIDEGLHSGVSGLQWIVDSYTMFLAAFMLTVGSVGDLYGHRRTFLWGLAVFTVASIACGLAPSTMAIIVARAVQGIGAAALLTSSLAILTQTFTDKKERARAIGIWAVASGVALTSGPVLGGLLTDSAGWRSVFFVNVPFCLIAAYLALRFVPNFPTRRGSQSLDVTGQVLGILALGSLTYVIIEGYRQGWASVPVIAGMLISICTFAGFLYVERRSARPMLPLGLFRSPVFVVANSAAAAINFGVFGMLFILSLYLQRVEGYSAISAGIRFIPLTATIVIAGPLAGRLTARYGPHVPMMTGLATAGVGALLLTSLDAGSGYGTMWWMFLLPGFGLALTVPPVMSAIVGTVPPARVGTAAAIVNASRQVGGVLGIAVLGTLVSSRSASAIRSNLTEAGVPSGVRDAIAKAGIQARVKAQDLPAGVTVAQVRRTVGEAFVRGMSASFLLAGAMLLLAAAAVAIVIRPRRKAEEASATPVTSDFALATEGV